MVTVEMGEGIRIQAQLIGSDSTNLGVGKNVVISFQKIDEEFAIPVVQLA